MIGDRIKQLRENKKLSLKELATAAKTTEASISRYENNLRQPRFDIVERIAKVLDTTIEYLVTGNHGDIDRNTSIYEDSNEYDEFMKKANAFFMNDDVSQEDKEAFFRDITELFWQSKELNRSKESKDIEIRKDSNL